MGSSGKNSRKNRETKIRHQRNGEWEVALYEDGRQICLITAHTKSDCERFAATYWKLYDQTIPVHVGG